MEFDPLPECVKWRITTRDGLRIGELCIREGSDTVHALAYEVGVSPRAALLQLAYCAGDQLATGDEREAMTRA